MWLLSTNKKGSEVIEKSIEIDSAPPPLPPENQPLDVYAKYAADLDAFASAFHDAVMSVFVKKQGHLAYLKGRALLRAKASSKVEVGWDEIFAAFGVKRSTGFVYIDIAETFSEEETEGQGVNELREEAQRRRAQTNGTPPEDPIGDPPDSGRVPPSNMYSVKKARNDLKTAQKRLEDFAAKINRTSDAQNNPKNTAEELAAFKGQCRELRRKVAAAELARRIALRELTASINELLVDDDDRKNSQVEVETRACFDTQVASGTNHHISSVT
jgi:hypothetical protein